MGIPLKSPVEGQDVNIDDKFILIVNVLYLATEVELSC